jgi:hypothetical protein
MRRRLMGFDLLQGYRRFPTHDTEMPDTLVEHLVLRYRARLAPLSGQEGNAS